MHKVSEPVYINHKLYVLVWHYWLQSMGEISMASGHQYIFTSSKHLHYYIPPFHRGETVERPLRDHKIWQISQRSFSEHSMISKVFHDSSMIFQWTLWSSWSPSNFELVQNSFSMVFEGSGLSVNAHRSLNERSTVSQVFQWSLRNLSTNATVLVNSLGHLVIAVGPNWSLWDLSWSLRERIMSTQWTLNGLCKEAWLLLVSWSTNAQRSLGGLRWSPWNLLKFEFLVPQGSPEHFHRDNFFFFCLFFVWGGGGGVLETAERSGQVWVSQWSPFCGKEA